VASGGIPAEQWRDEIGDLPLAPEVLASFRRRMWPRSSTIDTANDQRSRSRAN